MDELREKCPWDREQTWESLRHLSVEELYELSDAILENDAPEIGKELGDLLLHIVFYAKIGEEKGVFDIGTVSQNLCEKLIRRHPHIYGDVKVKDSENVKQNWEQIKLAEKGEQRKSILQGLPKSMPSLVKSFRMQDKVAQVGFDWPHTSDVLNKLHEELQELESATSKEEKEKEFGDILFALVNYARHEGINPDDALEKTNIKFKKRFEFIEAKAMELGRSLDSMSLEEMDAIWDEAKKSGIY